jgi:hypothetical protein
MTADRPRDISKTAECGLLNPIVMSPSHSSIFQGIRLLVIQPEKGSRSAVLEARGLSALASRSGSIPPGQSANLGSIYTFSGEGEDFEGKDGKKTFSLSCWNRALCCKDRRMAGRKACHGS